MPAVRFDMYGPHVPVERYVDTEPGKPMELGTIHLPLYSSEGGPADRYLYRASDGKLEMHNATFRVLRDYQGQGVGIQVFAKEAKALSGMWVARIVAEMAGWRGSSDQGYRVWPLFGYNTKPGQIEMWAKALIKDTSVSSAERSRSKSIGASKVTVLDLYRTAEGQNWWREHGGNTSGYFDLTPGSRSMQVLQSYVANKGLSWEGT